MPPQLWTTPIYLSGIALAIVGIVLAPKSPALLLGLLVSAWTALTLILRPSRRLSSPALAILALAALLHINFAGQPTELLAAGLIGVFAGVLPLLITSLKRTSFFPLPHMFGLLSAVYVATGFLLSGEERILGTTVSEKGRVTGLLLTGAFLVAMAVSAWLVLSRTAPNRESSGEVSANIHRSVLVAIGGEVVFFALILSSAADTLGQAPNLVRAVSHAAVIILFVAVRRGAAPPGILVVIVTIVAVEAAWGVGTSLLYNAVLLPLELLAVDVAMRRRVPWVLIFAAVSVALVGNATKDTVRSEGYVAGGFRLGAIAAYAQALPDTVTGLDRHEISQSAERFAYSQGDLLGYLSETVPDRLPRWDAGTYRLVPFAAVPRVLAPWKPKSDSANEFGRRYELLDANDRVTSANIPLAAEAYVNFGLPGLVLSGAVLGLVLGLLARRLPAHGVQNIAVAAVATGLLVRGIESDSSIVLGSVPWIILGLLIATRMLVVRVPFVQHVLIIKDPIKASVKPLPMASAPDPGTSAPSTLA